MFRYLNIENLLLKKKKIKGEKKKRVALFIWDEVHLMHNGWFICTNYGKAFSCPAFCFPCITYECVYDNDENCDRRRKKKER